jgi:GTPase SAR1 family protein
MNLAFILGTAGSGKTQLTSSFSKWLISQRENVAIMNLDPGAISLPYTPDVDVRSYVRAEDLMEEYTLGPNGALVLASDMIAEKIDDLNEELTTIDADIVLVDTPGQLELFAFRNTGRQIAESLAGEGKAVLYLFDAVFSRQPLNFVVNMFLSAAVCNKFFLPQAYLLTKVDLLKEREIDRTLEWASDETTLEDAIEDELVEMNRIMSQNMMQAISDIGAEFSLIPVSSKTTQGFLDVHGELTRILNYGEKFTV